MQPPAGRYSGSDARPVRLRRSIGHRMGLTGWRWRSGAGWSARSRYALNSASTGVPLPPCTRYFQHARLGPQANLPVDGGFRGVGQARAQVSCGEYPPPGDHDGGAAAAVAVSGCGRPPPAAPLGRRHPAAVFLAGAAWWVWTTGMSRTGRRSSPRASSATRPGPVDRPGGSCRALPARSPMSSENCSRRAGVPAPYLLVGHSRRRPAAGRATDHPVLHGDRRVQGSSVGRRYPARHHALPPSRRRRPAQRGPAGRVTSQFPAADGFHRGPAPSAELGEKSNISRVS